MKHHISISLLLLIFAFAMSNSVYSQPENENMSYRVAFLSDSHIQDVIDHTDLLRSMEAQVQSTRLFNENIFALRTALDDVASKGIKLVVISGDVTDDGQILNQLAAKKMLDSYEQKYGIHFFVTPGNHDPSAPFGKHSIGKAFLNPDGSTRVQVSDSSQYLPGYEVNPLMFSVGHKQQMNDFARFGYYPRADYVYWETPFSTYSYEDYTFAKASEQSEATRRMFTYADTIRAYDTSYLAEPVPGLWLLSIDCGVYLPDVVEGKYKNSGVGWNNTLQHKSFLITWVKHIYEEAHRLGKRVVAFSHFPLLDFNDGASPVLARSWGRSKFDIERIPNEEVSRALFDAGVRLHFAGHMHIYDLAVMERNGESMYNIQTPSLITCVPAYRILTLEDAEQFNLETVVVDEVEGYDTFFDRYRKELEYTKKKGKQPVWSVEVLQSKNYLELCDWQFRDLVRTRFAVRDVPKILQDELLPLSSHQLMLRVGAKKKQSKRVGQWTGLDLLTDFYRFHYSGSLALRIIPSERLKDYELLFEAIERSEEQSEFMSQMRDFEYAFKCFMNKLDVKSNK